MMKFKLLKKILPQSYTLDTTNKPLHSGEVFHLWDSLTATHQIINSAETFLLNTADKEMQLLLSGLVRGIRTVRMPNIEKLLKDCGFTVPPRPATKTKQGTPGENQAVQLADDEILTVLLSLVTGMLQLDAHGITTSTTADTIREFFVELLNEDMLAFEAIILIGKKKQAFPLFPNATGDPKGLNIANLYWLWDLLDYRYSSAILLESYLANTLDEELKKELKHGLYKITYPQMDKLEEFLKNAGFTVPARPVNRMEQQPSGVVGEIILKDSEILGVIQTANGVLLNQHIWAYVAIFDDDLRDLFKSFIVDEIDNSKRLIKLSKKRNILEIPPRVIAKRG